MGVDLGYTAATTGFASAATATDILAIGGKSGAMTKVRRIELCGKTTGLDPVFDVICHKRTVADSTGTQVPITVVPNGPYKAATCYVTAFTANPTLGNSTGLLGVKQCILGTTAQFNSRPAIFDFSHDPVSLPTSDDQVCLNLNGITVAGGALRATVELLHQPSS